MNHKRQRCRFQELMKRVGVEGKIQIGGIGEKDKGEGISKIIWNSDATMMRRIRSIFDPDASILRHALCPVI